jgi:PAS domain S-box-containing protein
MPDVTGERLRELREAEEHLRLVAENVEEVILIADADLSEVQYVNPAYEDVYGQPVERLYERPRSFLESVHPGDREAYEADVEAMLADLERDDPQPVYEGEYRLGEEEGERPRWIHVSRYPVLEDGARDETHGDGTDGRDGGATVERFVVVVEEVTERREYERAYREVFESGSDGLVVHDPETGEILDANERFCEMNGYGRDELVGETIDVVTAAGEGYSYEEADRYIRLAHEEGPQLFEWRNEREDGSTFPVEVHQTVAEIRGEERVLASVRDVTERKRREREREEERDKYTTLVEQSRDGVVIVQDGEYVFVNERFCEITGRDREALLGRPFEEAMAPEDRELVRERYERRVEGESPPRNYDVGLVGPDGDRVDVELAVSRITHGGEPATMATFREITERKRHERIVRALHESTERLQDAETPERVCEATVEAAEAVLGLSMPACWLHDEEASVLEPVAAPDPAWEVPGGPGTFEPGSVGYEVFERGEMATYDPGERREGTPLEHGVLVPLGEHGLLGVAEPGVGSYDDVVLDAARTLARHATTALDRVERAEERRESERRLRAVLERIDEAVFLTEEAYPEGWTGQPDYLSSGYEEIWGRPYEEFADGNRGSILETVHDEDRPAYRDLLDRVVDDIEHGDPEDDYAHEYRIERPDGEVRWIHSDLYPLRWTDERYRLVIVSRDITERRRREREYEQIFDTVNDAISVHDPETGAILEVNDTYAEEFGYDESTIRDLGVEGLSVTEEGYTGERSREVIREVAETGESITVEWLVETADGERRWYEVDTTPARIGGELRVLGISRDVTERKRRERLIRSLHESTDELQNAETVEAVCEATVTAMEEVLDLSLPVCWLRREGDPPALEPVAASDDAREFSGGPGPLEPGTFEYDLYERGEAAVYDPSERWDRTSLDHALMIPIGEHGVIGAAEPGVEEFDDVTLDAARILARHVTTALDRVDRARELRESERRFRLIAERIDEVIFLAEPDFSELFYVNDAYEELWGESVEALFDDPRGFVDGIDPRDREGFEAEFEAMLADIERGESDDSYTFEYRVRRPDDSVRWVRATGYPVELEGRDDGGAEDDVDTRFVGIVEDVTERRELERTYRAVFENVSDGLVVHEPQTGEILDVNEQYCELTGYTEEELVGGNVRLIVPEDPTDTYEDARLRIEAAREEGPQLFEFEGERKDGSRFIGEVHLSTVELRGEERVLASVRDVTERKRREREFEQIFNGVNDGITIHDPETGEILDANDTFCEITGYDREEIVDLGIDGVSATDMGYTLERAREVIREVIETGESVELEWAVETADGETRWLEVRGTAAEIGGERRYVPILRDVTERKQRKQELRRLTEEYETIFENAQDALFFVDVERTDGEREMRDEGGDEIEFVYRRTNRAHEEQTGFPSETVVGKTPRELTGEEAGAEIAANYRRCVEEGETITYEEELDLPAGEKVWQTKLSPVVIDGEVTQIVGIARDITEQRERERTLETFHDATRELVSAGSRREASGMAVTAAERVLGFPLVSVHLYDDGAGSLEPVAATDTLESVLDFLPSFDPGPSLPWQVFVDGESVRTAEVEVEAGIYGRGVSDPDVVLPLGPHGVMLVGAPDQEFDPGTVELAQILAATLQAALGHVRGQRELEERESELEAHRERADRLERLNTVIREIEQATVEESSREAIERAVCEHLTTVEPYREAWIAEPDVAGDALVTRASDGDGGSGGGSKYAETLAVDLGGDGPEGRDGVGGHPVAAAFRTGEVRTVGSLATSTAHGEWRKPALRAGYQSVVAVPLAGKESVHGVLGIAADDPGAFDEDTEEILAELGRSVGHAISVLERRAALESDTTTELEFEVADDGLSVVWLARETGAEVTLERTVRRPDGEFGVFYTVEGADPDRVVDRAAAAPDAEAAHAISEDDETCLVEVRTSSWFGTTFAEYGAVVRTATAEDGDGRLVVEAPRAADVRTLVEAFRERYPDTELVAQRTRERAVQTLLELQDLLAEQLTPRQLEALETAYSAGYFDWPRESSGEEIADLLGVTQPTFNKHLRSAERKTFSMLLEREYPE